jgi:type I restriction enzyme S subunit
MATDRRRGRRPAARRNGANVVVDAPRRGDACVAPTTVETNTDDVSADFDGDLPEGWQAVRPLAVADLIRGVSYAKGEAATNPGPGLVPLLRANNIAEGIVLNDLQYVPERRVSKPQLLAPGDVVLAMSSGSRRVVGKAAALARPWRGTFGAFCGVLRPLASVDAAYFGLYFQTAKYRTAISAMAAGTNINNLKREYFDQLAIPFPPTLGDQRRIVAKIEDVLSHVNASRDHLARVPALLKRFRQSVLAAACSGRLTEEWRIQRRASDEWPSVELQELLAEPMANGHSVPTADKGFPVLRLTALKNGRIDLSERKTGAWSPAEARRYLVRRDDFLVSRGNGSLRLVGRGGLVDSDPDAVAYPDTLIRIRPKLDILSTAFLRIAWDSPEVRSQIEAAAHTTAGIHKVSQQDLGVITVPQPTLSEQREIVRRVDALFALADSIEQRVADATARADALTQATLAKAFRGELVR